LIESVSFFNNISISFVLGALQSTVTPTPNENAIELQVGVFLAQEGHGARKVMQNSESMFANGIMNNAVCLGSTYRNSGIILL
jgi:hypothetical protein